MAIGHAPRLLADAQSGIKISTAERRLVIQYLRATAPEITNKEMSGWFQVSEKTIRDDNQIERKSKAKYLKENLDKDISLVIADIQSDFERQIADIEVNKANCKKGTAVYLASCQAIFGMRLKMIEAFQSIGYIPKNLGSMTQTKFEYKAVVLKDGSINTRSVKQFDDDKIQSVQMAMLPDTTETKVISEEMQEIIDADGSLEEET